MVMQIDGSVEAVVKNRGIDLHRGIDISYGIETSFFFMVRPNNAVWIVSAKDIDTAVLVRADDAFVRQHPDEAPAADWRARNRLPIIFESGTRPAVVESVDELCRHDDVFALEPF